MGPHVITAFKVTSSCEELQEVLLRRTIMGVRLFGSHVVCLEGF